MDLSLRLFISSTSLVMLFFAESVPSKDASTACNDTWLLYLWVSKQSS